MALHDEEQRRLAEIEQRLVDEDPRLARRLAEFRPTKVLAIAGAVLGVLMIVGIGLFALVTGAQLDSPLLIVLGSLVAVVIPTAICWRLWIRRIR